ncbi:hypothetical protein ACKWRH_20830 [Bradyrhizobium sp. Pa8]|uniref:hypothetical protein n=1 Tax=Bradyrhizobium sp. Pa8 TaxID=3386552 RepID=UPI00403F8774
MYIQNPLAVTVERIDAAIDLISEVMVRHDRPQFAPYVERLERELTLLQSKGDVMARARRRLATRAANDNQSSGTQAA